MKKPTRRYSMADKTKLERAFKEKRGMLMQRVNTIDDPVIGTSTFGRVIDAASFHCIEHAADLLKELRYLTIIMSVMSGHSRAKVCAAADISKARIGQIVTETLALYGIE